MEEPGQSGSVAKQAERDATDLDDIAQAPWQSEYRREFTWKTPLKSSLVHDVRDEAVQVELPLLDARAAAQPADGEKQRESPSRLAAPARPRSAWSDAASSGGVREQGGIPLSPLVLPASADRADSPSAAAGVAAARGATSDGIDERRAAASPGGGLDMTQAAASAASGFAASRSVPPDSATPVARGIARKVAIDAPEDAVAHEPHQQPQPSLHGHKKRPPSSAKHRQEYQDQRQQREADQPLMHLFGNGNTHPSVPELALKTFNVRAPPDQIYPHTAERGHRIRDFEATVLAASSPRDATTQRPRIINPTEALKQYMLAREQVAKLQASFRSEYQREFIDWTRSLDRIRASSRGSRLNKTLADHTPGADVDGKSAQMADPDLGAGAAERDLPGRDGGELDDAVKPKPGRSIIEELHGMPAAGVTTEQSSAYYEKRHFAAPADSLLDTGGPGPQTQVARERRGAPSPQIVPATWHLAQDVLKRASSRNRSVAGSPPPSATSPGQPPSPDARRVA